MKRMITTITGMEIRAIIKGVAIEATVKERTPVNTPETPVAAPESAGPTPPARRSPPMAKPTTVSQGSPKIRPAATKGIAKTHLF